MSQPPTPLSLRFASYNIHKAVGLDGRRDPERILAVLREVDADIVALQEVDRRFGQRPSVLPRGIIEAHTPYHVARLTMTSQALGWHGNAVLLRRGLTVRHAEPILLPTLEPRGAVCVEIEAGGRRLRVVGMHLDLSGLRRRHQLRAVLAHLAGQEQALPAVLMGDLNEWSVQGGALGVIPAEWQLLAPGRSFPARRPLATLDRIVASPGWEVQATGVHHSSLASRASDHLPVWARLSWREDLMRVAA